MQIEVSKSELAEALSALGKLVCRTAPVELYRSLRIDGKENKIELHLYRAREEIQPRSRGYLPPWAHSAVRFGRSEIGVVEVNDELPEMRLKSLRCKYGSRRNHVGGNGCGRLCRHHRRSENRSGNRPYGLPRTGNGSRKSARHLGRCRQWSHRRKHGRTSFRREYCPRISLRIMWAHMESVIYGNSLPRLQLRRCNSVGRWFYLS